MNTIFLSWHKMLKSKDIGNSVFNSAYVVGIKANDTFHKSLSILDIVLNKH
jgi:hypothetical protein